MRRRVVIVGGGMAGAIVASQLCDTYFVTVVDLAAANKSLVTKLIDTDYPAGYWPHAGSGPGGTTSLWQNGLIELDADDYAGWPIDENALDPYISKAYILLSGVNRDVVRRETDLLRNRYASLGVPRPLLGNAVFYPRDRRNVWHTLDLAHRPVEFVVGRALHFELDHAGHARAVIVRQGDSEKRIEGDVFVAACGGLSTPILMHETAKRGGQSWKDVTGRFYHDHPIVFVGETRVGARLYDLWNFSAPGLGGTIRLPFVVREEGLKFAFYLRPTFKLWRQKSRIKLRSILVQLRNSPYNLENYWNLLKNSDDIIDILSFRFGWNVPTSEYSILVVAEQPPDQERAVRWSEADNAILRSWRMSGTYLATMERAISSFAESLSSMVEDLRIFPEWQHDFISGAHHSGTCRMASHSGAGVCDSDAKAFELENLFVCDGSLIPSGGFANTGLTIGALALRLADHIRDRF